MNIKEQFDADMLYNSNHPLFTMTDDEVMGLREQGFYINDIIDNGHECDNIIFDNGHHYVLDKVEQMLYACEPIPEEYFIHKYLEKIVSDFIDKWSIGESEGMTHFFCSNNEIEAKSLIRLIPNRDEKIVYLTNIFIPIKLRHKGLGKLMIKQVFDVCQRLKCRLVLIDVVESFSNSLKNRNATFLDFDTIEITKETKLS